MSKDGEEAGPSHGSDCSGAQQAQRWLELILELTRTGVDIIDEDFGLHYVDPGWQKLYGDPAGQKCYAYFMGRTEPCPSCGIPNAIRTGQVQVTEETLPREGGRVIEVHTIPFRDADGRPLVAEFNLDVTARKRREERRLELERRQLHAQKLDSLGLLAGGIAHDFNNLLQAVLGNLELASYTVPTGTSAREHLDLAVGASRRVAELARQMLAYSGKGHFRIQPMDLGDLVAETTSLFRAAIPGNAELELEVQAGLPLVAADPGQMQQAVMNLLVNAAEAIGARPGRVTLRVSAGPVGPDELARSLLAARPQPGTFVRLSVTDDGCGMDAATVRRLFDPFFTTKTTGRGLGMPVVLGIARGHRGAILADTEPGRGTRIDLLLPAESGDAAAVEGPLGRANGVYGAEGVEVERGTVLVADDEDMVRRACCAMLERLGYRSIEARDGLEAVEASRRHGGEVACVLLDLTMPRMDGLAALEELRRLEPEVRVILTSGFSEQEASGRLGGVGPDAFLQKPFHMLELRSVLAGLRRRPG